MGWRFRKRVSLGRFARLNFSKSGVSLGLGPRGLNVNLGPKGVRTTVGILGTGLSYQTFDSWRASRRSATGAPQLATPTQPSRFPWRLAISVVVATVLVLGGRTLHSPSPSTSLPSPSAQPATASATAPSTHKSAVSSPQAGAALPQPAAMNADGIREVQSLLKELGHNPGPVDGVDGPLTRKATHDYLWAKGLAGSDEPTPALLARLRLDKSERRRLGETTTRK
jgi:hypothetical protein